MTKAMLAMALGNEEAMQTTERRYRPREIKLRLSQVRQRPIPTRTWSNWKNKLRISPDEEGFYSEEDYKVLSGLVKALNQGWTIQQYINWYLSQEEISTNGNRQGSASQFSNQDPIEVTATVC